VKIALEAPMEIGKLVKKEEDEKSCSRLLLLL